MQSEEAFVQVVTTHPTSVGQGGSMRGNVAPSGAVPSSGTVSSSSRLQTMYPGDTVFGRLSKHFRQEGKIVTISGTVKAPEYHIQWSDGTSSDCKRRGFWSAIEMQMASEASEPQPYDVPTKESVMLQRQQEQRQFEDMALKANNERLQQFVLKNSNHSIHNLPTPGFQTLSQGPLHQAQYVPHPQHEQQELDLFQAMFQNTSNSHPVGRQQIPSQEHGQEQSDDQHRAKIPRLGELSSRNEFDQQLPTYPSSTNGISSIQNILLGLAPEESLINRATAGTSTTVIPSLHPLTVDNHGLTTEDITAMNNGMSNGFNEGQYQSHPLFPQLQASQPQIARSTSNNSLFFQQQNSVEPSKPESLQHPHSVSEPTPSTQQSTFEPIPPYHILLPINKLPSDVRTHRAVKKPSSGNLTQNTNNTAGSSDEGHNMAGQHKYGNPSRYLCKICKTFKASHYCARCSRVHVTNTHNKDDNHPPQQRHFVAICEPATGRDCFIQHLRRLNIPEGHN